MPDYKTAKQQAIRESIRRALSTGMLRGDFKAPIGADREFRTPIYLANPLENQAIASTAPDHRSPSLSRMEISPGLQNATSIADYLTRVAPAFKHEKVHVLQNISDAPFIAADQKMFNNYTGSAKNYYDKLLPEIGRREAQAYFLSNTTDVNDDIKEMLGRDSAVPSIFDKFNLGKASDSNLNEIRQLILKSLPTGLQNIIGGWSK